MAVILKHLDKYSLCYCEYKQVSNNPKKTTLRQQIERLKIKSKPTLHLNLKSCNP